MHKDKNTPQSTASCNAYVRFSPFSSGKWFVGCAVNVTRYVGGNCGLQVTWRQSAQTALSKRELVADGETEGFLLLGDMIDLDADQANLNLYAGVWDTLGPEATVYIDNVTLINLTQVFGAGSEPDESTMLSLFYTWLSIQKQEPGASYRLSGGKEYPEADRKRAFLAAMRAKAADIGVTTLELVASPVSGKMSPRDLLKVLTAASGNETLCRIWSKKRKTIEVGGEDARMISVESSVTGHEGSKEELLRDYVILGGKTGTTSPEAYNLALIAVHKETRRTLAGVIMYADGHYTSDSNPDLRFTAMKELLDIGVDTLKGEDVSGRTVTHAESAICWEYPPFSGALCEGYEPVVLYAQDADAAKTTASTMKLLTALTALSFLSHEQLYETHVVSATEAAVTGSVQPFAEGDRVRLIDLFYAMLLPSCNRATHAIAYHVGGLMLSAAEETGAAPVITGQPTDVSGAMGETFTMSVTAEGDGLSYLWQYHSEGSSLWKTASGPDGWLTDTITAEITAARAGATYRCVVTDRYGATVYSDGATLTVV